FLYSREFQDFLLFRKNKIALLEKHPVDTAQVVHSDPQFYDAYRIAGDYCRQNKWYTSAISYYQAALSHEVATMNERESMLKKIEECKRKMKQ
ncbi:MAG TPA: hypothetical protein VN721_03780, partial [Flavipsychrobacter sp.]|nr:hypothetical protein [Flavipsychrobacter sp.]